MKKVLLLCILTVVAFLGSWAQPVSSVVVGAKQPDSTAILDLNSTKKGFLFPRVTTAQRNAIVNPANGLTLFNTETNCIETYNKTDTKWISNCGEVSSVATIDTTAFDCNSVYVAGDYSKGTPLNSRNFMKVNLSVTVPGSYQIQAMATTDNGYSFSGSGTVDNVGTIEVTLYGSGTPINQQVDNFRLKINGQWITSCAVSVSVTAPAYPYLRILGLGDESNSIDNPVDPLSPNGGRGFSMLTNTANFGNLATSKVKVTPFTQSNMIMYKGTDDATLYNYLYFVKPDIVLITQEYVMTAARKQYFLDYLNAGGVLIWFDQFHTTETTAFMNTLTGGNVTLTSCRNAAGIGKFKTVAGDPILNGSFKTLDNSLYWGEDFCCSSAGGNNIGITTATIPADFIPLMDNDGGSGAISCGFRSKSKNFVWIGDGGFLKEYTGGLNYYAAPNWIDNSGVPQPRAGYGTVGGYTVQNSFFLANVMEWAVKQAVNNGINYAKGFKK